MSAFAPELPSQWRAPLVSAALVVTAGTLLDRSFPLSLDFLLVGAATALLAWFFTLNWKCRHSGLPLVYLALAGLAFGAAWHHIRKQVSSDDISLLANDRPQPVRLRGRLLNEPRRTPAREDPLRTIPRLASSTTILRVEAVSQPPGGSSRGWQTASGKVLLYFNDPLTHLHVGDEIEVAGKMSCLSRPLNPGQKDLSELWNERGVYVRVSSSKSAVVQLSRGWPDSVQGWLAILRESCHRTLETNLPADIAPVTAALLLNEGAPMTQEDWDRYKRTGIIHVLVISGQHLVILAGVLWWLSRRLYSRQRYTAVILPLFLWLYVLLTGGEPPAVRAAVTLQVLCSGYLVRRTCHPANNLALGWLLILLLDPVDIYRPGCQLSFLAVALLIWGNSAFFPPRPDDPLLEVLHQADPLWLRGLRFCGRALWNMYLVNWIVCVGVLPLSAGHMNMVAPGGFLLGPPVTFLTTLALLAGFPLLLIAPFAPVLATPCVSVIVQSLRLSNWLVDGVDACNLHLYTPDLRLWWLCGFYLHLAFLLMGARHLANETDSTKLATSQSPQHSAIFYKLAKIPLLLAWLCLGLGFHSLTRQPSGLRCTFLAVGHGGCIVLETPDGRTLLYDVGAITGPEVASQQIAPYLWHRGIRRIDEVFLSHADLDHFNGLPLLAERFAIGQVTTTPTFADRPTRAVQFTTQIIDNRRIPLRTVWTGQRLSAGAVSLEVLHPPISKLEGPENVRSLVLLVRHGGHSLLFTGDLEGAGLAELLRLPPVRVDVLLAPHHGSHRVDGAALVRWCRPRLVVSSQGPILLPDRTTPLYRSPQVEFWTTYEHGAITIRSQADGLVAETFRTKKRLAWPGGS